MTHFILVGVMVRKLFNFVPKKGGTEHFKDASAGILVYSASRNYIYLTYDENIFLR